MTDQTTLTDGQRPPVSPTSPLVGLEQTVLSMWLESPHLAEAYKSQPASRSALERAARARVEQARVQELQLRAEGLSLEEAQSISRPPMWTPPTLHPTTT